MAKPTVKIGMTFHATHADANPEWTVLRKSGREAWICRVTAADPDYAGSERAFMTREILRGRAAAAIFAAGMRDHKAYYASLKPGAVVHYDNGFFQFVRCEVTIGDPVPGDPAPNKLKPIALVGPGWRKWDLPHRTPEGAPVYCYHAKKIAEGGIFEPNFGCIYESPRYARRAGTADPATMPAHDLSPDAVRAG